MRKKMKSTLLARGKFWMIAVMSVVVLCAVAPPATVNAREWTAGNLTLKLEDDQYAGIQPICGYGPLVAESVSVVRQAYNYPWMPGQSYALKGCITNGKSVDMVDYFVPVENFYGRGLRFHGDGVFRDLMLPDGGRYNLSTDTYIVTYAENSAQTTKKLLTTRNLGGVIMPVQRDQSGVITRYGLNFAAMETWMWDENDVNKRHDVQSKAMSSEGRYVFAYIDRKGFVKIDLDEKTVTKVLDYESALGGQVPTASAVAISKDGRYTLFRNNERQSMVMIDTHECGQPFGNGFTGNMSNVCPTLDLRPLAEDRIGPIAFNMLQGSFLDNGDVTMAITGAPSSTKLATYTNFEDTSTGMDYIALGDSYSSGEGDIEKKVDGSSFYTADTDIDGGCHLSIRSYPFLLRDYWKFTTSRMQSVACSGATIAGDYNVSPSTYIGQHRELEGLSSAVRADMVDGAFENYRPGIVPQLEFVKKNKPKVITLTGGGNDVGFASILHYCAGDIAETAAVSYSCEYVEGSILQEVLNDKIDSQFANIKKLIQDIKVASPSSKIYYIGYPSFIAGSEGSCAFNNGALNGKERDMINRAVSRLNSVIRDATASTGARYIDIESALKDGRMCEGSEYMTGIADYGLYKVYNDRAPGVFHPNANGHLQIAKMIEATIADPITNYRPDPPKVVAITPKTQTKRAQLVKDDKLTQGDVLRVRLEPNTTAASSEVVVVAYSQPTQLGTYYSNNDGSIDISLQLPKSIGPGLHLLTLMTTSPSGEPLRLFQYLPVISDNHDDLDGDGIKNLDDTCLFIRNWYDETGKNVCAKNVPNEQKLPNSEKGSGLLPINPQHIIMPGGDARSQWNEATTTSVLGASNNFKPFVPAVGFDSKEHEYNEDVKQRPSVAGILSPVIAVMCVIGVILYGFHKKSS